MDISNTFRIKCAVCLDFDLCVDCFHVGVELTPHKRTHSYKVRAAPRARRPRAGDGAPGRRRR